MSMYTGTVNVHEHHLCIASLVCCIRPFQHLLVTLMRVMRMILSTLTRAQAQKMNKMMNKKTASMTSCIIVHDDSMYIHVHVCKMYLLCACYICAVFLECIHTCTRFLYSFSSVDLALTFLNGSDSESESSSEDERYN